MRIVDCHIHVWRDSDTHRIWVRDSIAALRREYTVADFARAAPVDGVVVIEAAETVAETVDLCTSLVGEPLVKGVVGWVDLTAPDAGETLERLSGFGLLRGVRLLPAFDGGPNWSPSAALARGLRALERRGLTLDILAAPGQLATVRAIKELAPGLTVVLNHGGRPFTMCGPDPAWSDPIRGLGRDTDVCCKLSGLIERAGFEWNANTIRPFVDVLVQSFGPERLAFASNWPMLELTGTHRRWLEAVRQLLDEFGLTGAEKSAIFAGTASKVYRLDSVAVAEQEPAHG
jgi:L-fuconolactonase